MKTGRKLEDNHKAILIDIIARGIIEGETSIKMAKHLKEMTGVKVTEQNVSWYRTHHRDKISDKITEFAADLVKDCPITRRDFRLWEIQALYKCAHEVKDKLACIREARNEIDAHGDKIADAIKNSGTRLNIFDFGGMSDEERKRYAEQCEKYFAGINGNGSRFHITK